MIRVASIPASHPYVAAITDPQRVSLLPDPIPIRVTVPGQWWPPRWLEPQYLLDRVNEFDVMHVHFGFDTTPTRELLDVCAILAAHGKPLVVTVHDLHNPHFADSTAHRSRLNVLVSYAASVITLTGGAARAIGAEWHRSSTVIAHPHLLPLSDVGAARVRRNRPVVAVHAKSLRANIDPWLPLDVLSAAHGRFSVRLDLDDHALASHRAPADLSERLERYRSRGVDVRVHPEFDDAQLLAYLHEIDVLVLPYRFGTHSGWVEICHDAGVAAVVPDCGHFSEQHRAAVFGFDSERFDRASLLAAVDSAVLEAGSHRGGEDMARRRFRALQREGVRAAHLSIYRHVLENVAA